MKLIPVQIRPHLIPFLFKEMEGSEASYMEQKSKSIKISPFSSLGRFLHSQCPKYKNIGKHDKFIIYLTIERKKLNVYNGSLYISLNQVNEIVCLQECEIQEINNLLEDIFRIAFIYYLDGYLEHSNQKSIKEGINKFIDKYDLLEFDFTEEGLRRLYYREKNKSNKISRTQFQSATRVHNFDIDPRTMSQYTRII